MRHAVAPAGNVENNSLAVTRLLKICTRCDRLGKKVSGRKRHRAVTSSAATRDTCRARCFLSCAPAAAQPLSGLVYERPSAERASPWTLHSALIHSARSPAAGRRPPVDMSRQAAQSCRT